MGIYIQSEYVYGQSKYITTITASVSLDLVPRLLLVINVICYLNQVITQKRGFSLNPYHECIRYDEN